MGIVVSRLSEIPIHVLSPQPAQAGRPPTAGGLGGGVHAVLAELATLLDDLAEHEIGGTIDLRSLPMEAQDRQALNLALGEGEVRATLDADGLSHFRETGVPGVWWVEHRDRSGAVVAELLEVATVPAILTCAPDEIAEGRDLLRARIAALGKGVDDGRH